MPHSYRKPLGRSISIGCLTFIILLCLVLCIVNYQNYKSGLYKRYEAHITDLLNIARSHIDADDLASCVESNTKSQKYLELQKFIDNFKDNANIHYLYVIKPLNKNPSDNVKNIIAAMSTYEKNYMPEMEVTLNGLTGEEYSVETVSKYLAAAEDKEIAFFSNDWVKDKKVYIDFTGALPIYTSSGDYIGLLCIDIDITEIKKVIMDSTLKNIIMILLLGLFFIVIFIIWANYNIVKPIQKLESSVTAYAYQNRSKEDVDSLVIKDPGIHTDNEVESLAHSVVKMSEDMRNYMEDVIEAESKARLLSELANKDPLTNIRNKTAYDRFSEGINKQIEEGTAEFALAMIDLNHLKLINDTYGHENENEYIKMSCMVICNIFKHSAVFRIGGDEFVAIMKGEDYKNRGKVLKEAEKTFKKASDNQDVDPWQRISAAIGLADFDPESDKTIEDVFKRADKIMYANKIAMKATRKA